MGSKYQQTLTPSMCPQNRSSLRPDFKRMTVLFWFAIHKMNVDKNNLVGNAGLEVVKVWHMLFGLLCP